MKSLLSWFILLVSITLLVSSCASSDDSTTTASNESTSTTDDSGGTDDFDPTLVVVVVLSVVEVELSEAVNSSFSSLLEHDENSNVMLTKRTSQEVRLFILFLSKKTLNKKD